MSDHADRHDRAREEPPRTSPSSERVDRLSLEQALLDFEVANARVLDLTHRLTELNQELLELRSTARAAAHRAQPVAGPPRRPQASPLEAGRPPGAARRPRGQAAAPVTAPRRRVLLAITAYNGRDFLERTLHSALRIDTRGRRPRHRRPRRRSPEPGFAEWLADACASSAASATTGRRATSASSATSTWACSTAASGHDYVIICNSDVIYPQNLLTGLIAVADSDETHRLGHGLVEQRLDVLAAQRATPTPAGRPGRVDWCPTRSTPTTAPPRRHPGRHLLLHAHPAPGPRGVGLMDPVFGRGLLRGDRLDPAVEGARATASPSPPASSSTTPAGARPSPPGCSARATPRCRPTRPSSACATRCSAARCRPS